MIASWLLRHLVVLGTVLALVGCNSPLTPTGPATTQVPNPSTCPVTLAAAPDAVPAPVAAFMIGGMILPAGMTPAPLRTMYGNDALWVDLGTSDGTLPGVLEPAGHLGAKFGTYRLVDGSLSVSARRLDGPRGDVAVSVPDGYGVSGFQSMGISFSSVGCWSVTETVDGHDLVFVIRIASSAPPSPSASFTVSGASPAAVALVVRFVDAFNAGDLERAGSLFADDANVSDCDFTMHTVVEAQGRDAIRAWLAARFADHDRLVIGSIFNHNPDSDRAVGVEFANRTSDTIARLGAPDGITPGLVAKVVLDASGERLGAFANGPGGADPVVVIQACSVTSALTTDHPTLTISPSTRLKDGQTVQVRVTGFGIGAKVWLSECSSATAATDLGCGVDLAAQPFIVTGDDRAGSASFVVRVDIPGRAPSGGPATPCADQCVVVATMGSGAPYVVAPISFTGP